ncbi:MAG: pyruvate formate lyase family protein, partial [Prevotella sp.]|nr:pyruvate formate lyase family protein [Prevotella sp.]
MFYLGQDARGYGIVDSCIPAYYKIIPLGLPALLNQARRAIATALDQPAREYYESVIIVTNAALMLIARYETLIRGMIEIETDEKRKKELLQMADNIRYIQHNAPTTFWQAVQLMYFIQFLIWVEGGYLIPLGRTDQILYPFYKRDIENSILTQV